MSCDYHSARSLKNKYNSEFFAQAYPAADEVLGVSCSGGPGAEQCPAGKWLDPLRSAAGSDVLSAS